MATNLYGTIRGVFQNPAHSSYHRGVIKKDVVRYMEIPTDKEQFEIPMFALPSFIRQEVKYLEEPSKIIIAELCRSSANSNYKTVESIFKDLFSMQFANNRLATMQIKETEPKYYISNGVVLDMDYHPMLMLSWIMERVWDRENPTRGVYRCVKPILRIDPSCFILRCDSVQRFICGKFLSTSLTLRISTPSLWIREISTVFQYQPNDWRVSVEIAECPFTIKKPDAPSISTDRQSLLKVALDNIDEIVS